MTPNVDEALALLRGAAARKPEDFTIRQRLVEACARAGRYDEAAREFAALVKATPDFPQVHFDALARAGQVADGGDLCRAFERATQAAPNDVLAWYGLGLTRQSHNDQDGAADAFKAGLKVAQHNGLLQYNLGVILMDRPAMAEVWLGGAVRCAPKMAEPHYALGTIFMTRDRERAVHHFREFIRLAPTHLAGYADRARRSLEMLGEVA